MSRYTCVAHNQWYKPEFETLSAEALLVYQFVRTAPSMTALGCCIFDPVTISRLIHVGKKVVASAIRALTQEKLLSYDARYHLFFVHEHFNENPISNPKVAQGALNMLPELPPSPVLAEVAQAIHNRPVKDFHERFVLIEALQERCGVWSVGKEQAELPLTVDDENGKGFGKGYAKGFPDSTGKAIPLSVAVPVAVAVTVPQEASSNTVPDIGAKGLPPPLARLSVFAAEVGRYNPDRPLCDAAFSGGMQHLQAAEAALDDLAAATGEWEREVRDRLRRDKEIDLMKKSKCPASNIGKLARWALADLRKETGGVSDGKLSARAQARLDEARRAAAEADGA